MRTLLILAALCNAACSAPLTINQIQFVGSHNSYKKAMLEENMAALEQQNPAAARSLAYEHVELATQLDLGLRKLELDVFYDSSTGGFIVGHVQVIDMESHCAKLSDCLAQIRAWSSAHPRHVPIWISFNAKDQPIDGLPLPDTFDARAFALLDAELEAALGDVLIRPRDVQALIWPTLEAARGKFLLILDEGGAKREIYWENWISRPMFTNAPLGHEAAAVMIINNPLEEGARIAEMVEAGYLVRTRADADTAEARSGDTAKRDAAFASGAQAISTDYYMDENPFGTGYRVAPVLRCNPRNAPAPCEVTE